jgi:hypothetical protein
MVTEICIFDIKKRLNFFFEKTMISMSQSSSFSSRKNLVPPLVNGPSLLKSREISKILPLANFRHDDERLFPSSISEKKIQATCPQSCLQNPSRQSGALEKSKKTSVKSPCYECHREFTQVTLNKHGGKCGRCAKKDKD